MDSKVAIPLLTGAEQFLANSKLAPSAIAEKRSLLTKVSEKGLPKKNIEEWKYCDTSVLSKLNLVPYLGTNTDASSPATRRSSASPKIEGALNLFFDEDTFVQEISDTLGSVTVTEEVGVADRPKESLSARSVGSAVLENRHFVSTEVATDTLHLYHSAIVRKRFGLNLSAKMERPIAIHLYSSAIGNQSKSDKLALATALSFKIRAAANSKCTIYFVHHGSKDIVSYQSLEVDVVADSKSHLQIFDHYLSGENDHWRTQMGFSVAAEAKITSFLQFAKTGWLRTESTAHLVDENASVELNGILLTTKGAQTDVLLDVQHQQRSTFSKQKYKAVLDDNSKFGFTGSVRITKAGQKSEAEQLANAMIIDHKSEFNARPILQIYADDVKAKHGAATAEINKDELFYLRSRGLSEKLSRQLLKRGFVAELLQAIDCKPVAEALRQQMDDFYDAQGDT